MTKKGVLRVKIWVKGHFRSARVMCVRDIIIMHFRRASKIIQKPDRPKIDGPRPTPCEVCELTAAENVPPCPDENVL